MKSNNNYQIEFTEQEADELSKIITEITLKDMDIDYTEKEIIWKFLKMFSLPNLREIK